MREHENPIERHAIAGIAFERHDGDRIADGDAILLAAGLDDREQLTSLVFPAPRAASHGFPPNIGTALMAAHPAVEHRRPQISAYRSFVQHPTLTDFVLSLEPERTPLMLYAMSMGYGLATKYYLLGRTIILDLQS